MIGSIWRTTRTAAVFLCGVAAALSAYADAPPPDVEIWALELPVTELQAAVGFYTEAMGFEVEHRDDEAGWATLRNGRSRLLLRQDATLGTPSVADDVSLNFRVLDLAQTVEQARQAGATVLAEEPIPVSIGSFTPVLDPSGNALHLMDIDGDDEVATAAPQVFNFGLHVPDMDASEAFYAALGFEVFSRDYLPDTLPFNQRGTFSFVLHPADASAPRGAVLLATKSFDSTVQALRQSGFQVEPSAQPAAPAETMATLTDPSGHRLHVVSLPAAFRPAADASPGSP